MIVMWIKSRRGRQYVCSVFTAPKMPASHCVSLGCQDECCQLSVVILVLFTALRHKRTM